MEDNPDSGVVASLRLSVLDQSPISEGSSGAEALHNTLDLARLADRLGYHRYWLAEHHGTSALACASPEAVIGPVAAATTRLRVGSGGIMLPHYSPYKVAETFSILSGLFPGRIDLGIGRAPGTDGTTTIALQRDRRQPPPDDFLDQLLELIGYLEDRIPPDHPFARLARLPGLPESPELWLLGSSSQSGEWAAQLGLPYVFADFISAAGTPVAARYRAEFAPSARLAAPRAVVAVRVVCAQSDEEALRLSASNQMQFAYMERGYSIPVPTVETALAFLEERGMRLGALPMGRRMIVGGPATVRRGIEKIARDYGAHEVMIVTITHDHAARRRSYELIAEAFAPADAALRG